MKLLQTKNAETARIQSWLDIKAVSYTHLFAGCIANALLDRDVPVLMTNFPTIRCV